MVLLWGSWRVPGSCPPTTLRAPHAAPMPIASGPKNYLGLFEGELFDCDSFTDCKLVFDDHHVVVYHCHRSVMSLGGSVFKAQLTAPMEGGDPNVFNVDLPFELEEAGVHAFMMTLYCPESLHQVDCP